MNNIQKVCNKVIHKIYDEYFGFNISVYNIDIISIEFIYDIPILRITNRNKIFFKNYINDENIEEFEDFIYKSLINFITIDILSYFKRGE